jgi:hypothetical protein
MLTLDPAGTLFHSAPTACPMKQRNVGPAFLDEQKLEQNR